MLKGHDVSLFSKVFEGQQLRDFCWTFLNSTGKVHECGEWLDSQEDRIAATESVDHDARKGEHVWITEDV